MVTGAVSASSPPVFAPFALRSSTSHARQVPCLAPLLKIHRLCFPETVTAHGRVRVLRSAKAQQWPLGRMGARLLWPY
jgi:hypothetical protein